MKRVGWPGWDDNCLVVTLATEMAGSDLERGPTRTRSINTFGISVHSFVARTIQNELQDIPNGDSFRGFEIFHD